MRGKAGANSRLSVNPLDRRGRPIIPAVLRAADEIARRAIGYAQKLSVDPAVAADLLEEAAATVSRTVMRQQMSGRSIQDLQSYLFRSFLRRLNRKHKRSLPVAEAFQAKVLASSNSIDPRKLFENKILIDEFLTHCDPVTRDILCHRIEGRSWNEIGRIYQISRRAAESRFNQKLQKVRQRLGLK